MQFQTRGNGWQSCIHSPKLMEKLEEIYDRVHRYVPISILADKVVNEMIREESQKGDFFAQWKTIQKDYGWRFYCKQCPAQRKIQKTNSSTQTDHR